MCLSTSALLSPSRVSQFSSALGIFVVQPDRIVDDELEAGKANALFGKLTKVESHLWAANVDYEFRAYLWKLAEVLHILLEL